MKLTKGSSVSAIAVVFGVLVVTACGGTGGTATVPVVPTATGARAVQAVPTVMTPTLVSATSVAPVQGSTPTASAVGETPLAPEMNLPGDIPDNQVFVPYTAPDGYTLQVPEGWARMTTGSTATFTDKFNGLSLETTPAVTAPTVENVRAGVFPTLEKNGRAVQVQKVEQVMLPSGQTVRITATANSAPNPVTGKQIRQEEQHYLFFKGGKQVMLSLWAPQGADNVDSWQQIAGSFRWSP